MDKIRILIVDDYPSFRNSLRTLLGGMPDYEVVGEAVTGEQAIAQASALQPDVILMDIQMPQPDGVGDGAGINGIEATRQIVSTSPHIGIIMLTMFHDDESVFAAMRAGARGYILKGAARAEIMRAIQAAASGEALFSPAIAERLMRFFRDLGSNIAPTAPRIFSDVTDREREILQLIAQGASNAVIADQLSISLKTVRNHVSNIFAKLQVADRAQAIVRARQAGLG